MEVKEIDEHAVDVNDADYNRIYNGCLTVRQKGSLKDQIDKDELSLSYGKKVAETTD